MGSTNATNQGSQFCVTDLLLRPRPSRLTHQSKEEIPFPNMKCVNPNPWPPPAHEGNLFKVRVCIQMVLLINI